MSRGTDFRNASYRLTSTLAFGGSIAALAVLIGTHDLEGYDVSFLSLNRGTAVQAVQVLGHPVHTLALGLGVRLPLHGALGASPAAVVAPYLPAPLIYWLLLTLSISAAAILVRHALEPLVGRLASWVALVLLFCSAPMVGYTVYDDWPENAVTYPAYIASVFAPHALLGLVLSLRSSAARGLAGLAVACTLSGLLALAHAGHWPLLAASLVLGSMLALCRSDHPLRTRLAIVAALAVASFLAVAPQVPDVFRELQVAGDIGEMRRLVEGPRGSLVSANAFPFREVGPRLPFTYLVLALVSLSVGLTVKEPSLRRLTVAGALISVMLGVTAATLFPGRSAYAPSITWALRDPAIAFAVFSAACAGAALRRSRGVNRIVGAGPAVAALVLAGLQGPAYAARLVFVEVWRSGRSLTWNQDMTAPEERASMRGLSPNRLPPGERLAFWPGVRQKMRNAKRPTTDFVDAGYLLVTAWTKDRTMRGLVEPNQYLFNQEIELSPEVLCDANAVHFLQLRYLLRPSDVATCAPWARDPELMVDGWLDVDVAREVDRRIRALPTSLLAEPLSRRPGLSAGSTLLPALAPLSGTSLTIESPEIVLRLDEPSIANGQALVLPVAYDAAWRASAGQTHNVGGLLALVGVERRQVRVEFVPDMVAVLRAVSMTLAQILALGGLLGLAYAGRVEPGDAFLQNPIARWARGAVARLVPVLRQPRNWLYVAYSIAVGQRLTGLLLPITALVVARLAQRELVHRWTGAAVLAVALLNVAAGSSRSAAALHDPLFWSLMAVVALGVSAVTGRWPAAASAASAFAGAATAVAMFLPAFPDFASTFPAANLTIIRESFRALSGQFGVLATVFLLGLWLQAIVGRGNRFGSTGRMDAAVRGALLAALLLSIFGAVPTAGINPGWIVALGLVLGLAEANARQPR